MDMIKELMCLYDVTVTMCDVPGCRASVDKYKGGYLILVNPDLSERTLERTLTHELLHIVYGHLDDRIDLPEEEKELEVRTALKAMGY